MIPAYRVFIVDDQTDIRRMLRVGVENLGSDIQVIDVPSAEEALLEMSRLPADLLITDIRLPGISGIELVAKARKRYPNLKIILVTALTDSRTRKQATELGAEAFFTKPLDMPDFLEAIEHILGIVHSIVSPQPILPSEFAKGPFTPVENLSGRLASLRKDLAAAAVLLLDDGGQVLAQAGVLPEESPGAVDLIPAVMTTFSSSLKISQCLGMKTPRSLMVFPGSQYSLCLTHVGSSYALLAVTDPGNEQPSPRAIDAIEVAIEDLLISLANIDSTRGLPLVEPLPIDSLVKPKDEQAPEPIDDLTAEDSGQVNKLFQNYHHMVSGSDLDQFWETAAEESKDNGLGNASVISYEQAKKLGLAPE